MSYMSWQPRRPHMHGCSSPNLPGGMNPTSALSYISLIGGCQIPAVDPGSRQAGNGQSGHATSHPQFTPSSHNITASLARIPSSHWCAVSQLQAQSGLLLHNAMHCLRPTEHSSATAAPLVWRLPSPQCNSKDTAC